MPKIYESAWSTMSTLNDPPGLVFLPESNAIGARINTTGLLAAQIIGIDRGNGAGTVLETQQHVLSAGDITAGTATVKLIGLNPNTPYEVRAWVDDGDD